MTMKRWGVMAVFTVLIGCAFQACSQDQKPDPVAKETIQYERIDGALIYDHDPATKLGDDIFGTIISDLEHDFPGRNSHGGPVCMEYPNGQIVAFNSNTSDHNNDGWSEYAVSPDGGKTWEKYNKFPYSYESYQKDPNSPVFIEEGLVTQNGTVVLVLTHIRDSRRAKSSIMRSGDNGSTWTDNEPLDGDFGGYPCAVAVAGDTNYVLFDLTSGGPHVLYVSTDDGRSWHRRSTLPLDGDTWYGAMTMMADGRLLAGAYTEKDEHNFYYCISKDQGKTWSPQKRAYVDKKVRDPELAYLAGKYYLHGRSGQLGEGSNRFVLYQSNDGIEWQSGIIASGDELHPDGYSHNCIINQYNDDIPNELMVQYSIIYEGAKVEEIMTWDKSLRGTPGHEMDINEYVFFIKPEPEK